ncbi:hypothetical protein Tco_0670357 [Tanacetum coccineum]
MHGKLGKKMEFFEGYIASSSAEMADPPPTARRRGDSGWKMWWRCGGRSVVDLVDGEGHGAVVRGGGGHGSDACGGDKMVRRCGGMGCGYGRNFSLEV